MSETFSVLGDITPTEFLKHFWQKKPLLIKGGFTNWTNPIEPDELAGLACEQGIDARLVLERAGDYPWQVRTGPFNEQDLSSLPESHWSLLVRRVDQWVPDVAALKQAFRFIPTWRLEDVMVSLAAEQGGVGAHIDNYDVFLVQGYGTRRWEIGAEPLGAVELRPLSDIAILDGFTPDHIWTVEPGDVLYLPPRVAHAGIALEDCMTYSFGFRAPSEADIIEGYSQAVADTIDPERLYRDPDLTLQANPGEITLAALERVEAILTRLQGNPELLRVWFGKHVTQAIVDAPWPDTDDIPEVAEIGQLLSEGVVLRRTESVRCAYLTGAENELTLFVNGEAFRLEGPAAEFGQLFAAEPYLTAASLGNLQNASEVIELIYNFIESGFMYLADADD